MHSGEIVFYKIKATARANEGVKEICIRVFLPFLPLPLSTRVLFDTLSIHALQMKAGLKQALLSVKGGSQSVKTALPVLKSKKFKDMI